MRPIDPLPPEQEQIVQQVAKEVMSKPGFARTESTLDYLCRGLRKAVRSIQELERKNSENGSQRQN